ncbi:hypothetical protein TA3x_004628 [Tundrisphaera sp. TA3]|uniref:hypothetical protein n=1 Tax=Tundrisphaera sp. TA3 TaxID=3435775 RepID=UPI003EB7948E
MNGNQSHASLSAAGDLALETRENATFGSAMPVRGLRLSESMILIAALATGLLFNKWMQPMAHPLIRSGNLYSKDSLVMGMRLVMPHLASLSAAIWAISVRRPRPGLEPRSNQPGFLACTIASAGVASLLGWLALNRVIGRDVIWNLEVISMEPGNRTAVFLEPFWHGALPNYGDRIGLAVASAWLTLRMLGRWEARPDWIDRCGRILGAGWIFCAGLIWARPLLP